MSGAPGQAARQAAAAMLGDVVEHHRTMGELTADPKGPLAALEPAERARATSLALGVLRVLPQLDAVLDPMFRKPPPWPVRQALRIAAWEILIDGVAEYAAVDAAVRLVRGSRKHQHLTGLTNAVARRLTREGAEAWAARPDAELPRWIGKPVTKTFGAEAAAAIAAAHQVPPPLDITPKDPGSAAALAEVMEATLLPSGSVRVTGSPRVTGLPGYDEGQWWVQDAAAAMPVQMLGELTGLRVVDLCAAPGGKTMQLAARGAQVSAVDISADRLARVRENLDRTHLEAEVIAADALNWAPEGPVDVVLLDAPCSATGTLRRHPDLPYARVAPDLGPLLQLQADLIDRAWSWLQPGGRLLYCTCSLLPREGETQISLAQERHGDMVEGTDAKPAGTEPGWWSDTGALRLRPDFWADRGGMDGFFATVLTKGPLHG